MSYVAPVRAVLVMRCTASAATSAGPTTRPIGRVARSSARRSSSLVAEQRRRQRRVDEAGGDEVDPDRGELEREGGDERRQHRGGGRGDAELRADPPGAGATHEQQRAAGPHLPTAWRATARASRTWSLSARRTSVGLHLEQRPVVGAAGRDQHVVDRVRQVVEERVQRAGSVASNAAVLLRADLPGRPLEPARVTAGETTSAPSAPARRAVSRPMPALPPITTTV